MATLFALPSDRQYDFCRREYGRQLIAGRGAPATAWRGWISLPPRNVTSVRHSLMVRTTLEVGRALTVLPPNSFMIASSYSGSVFTGSFALTCTIL